MKPHVRILGIDDSPFKFKDQHALVVGALVRVPNYLESVMKTEVVVDGTDATLKLVEMIKRSRYREQIKAVMLDGITLAGFNVVDIEQLCSSTGTPVITITRNKPDLEKMRDAMMKYFDDWKVRYEVITKLELRRVKTEHKPVYVSSCGGDDREMDALVSAATVKGAIPEPIRIAHLVASAMVRGESYGSP
ncbi:MAG: hypothetical protein A3K60_02090 [Euryarchaeota archaeon RBG_19FT_COMBO_56_21]|nr:MAG: hypothetical protein A3K60_02090 [Euryarchaeota archaeon RBG_19FT_COMBO_56_21]